MPRGPKISAERRGILSFIDERIKTLRKQGKDKLGGEETTYAAQLFAALRDDLRQELDLADDVESAT